MASTFSRWSEPSATCLMCCGRLFRPTHRGPPLGSSSKLGGDHHLSAARSERFAHELLVRVRAVHLGGVEEGDATFNRGPKERGRLLLVGSGAVAEAHSHAAEPDGRDFQLTVP